MSAKVRAEAAAARHVPVGQILVNNRLARFGRFLRPRAFQQRRTGLIHE
jgi:hypothetical protein